MLPEWDVELRVVDSQFELENRVSISDGVTEAPRFREYAAGARVPRQPFASPTRQHLDHLFGRRGQRSDTVGVVRVSDRLLVDLRAAALDTDRARLDAHSRAVCDELSRAWAIETPPKTLGVGRNPVGLSTVTRDPDTQEFVGMHVDTFHDEYDAARATASNRLSINIGAGPRYFLFVPVTFRKLAQAGGALTEGSIVSRFLTLHPEQSVIRVRIDPGEAYIAPTEALIHDASSLTMRTEDVHVTGRGVLTPR